jgi:hypothetical protein
MMIRILIACHKKSPVPADPLYLPLQVGAEGKESIGFQRDDEGAEISSRNSLYCELTGLYWGWKNLSADGLGLVQYRRHFTMHSRSWCAHHSLDENVLTAEEARQLLERYAVLVPKKRRYYIETIYSQYDHTFDGRHLDAARAAVRRRCPEYLPDFDAYMKARSGWMFNMFLMRRPLADAYCQWLFPLLEDVEAQIDSSGMNAFEKRYIGRVSERLLDVWLLHQVRSGILSREEIHEIPYFYLGKVDWPRKIRSFLAAKLFGKKYTGSF